MPSCFILFLLIFQVKGQIKEAMIKVFTNEFERQDMCIKGYELNLGPYHVDILPPFSLAFQFGPVTVTFSK